ncbi:ATP-binding protein [uncultured Tolumonas sp.]|uniref:ATP-binding protein n=1 Tax=uncultured Tolumonas sp. TaxID=263765 RepID=UPI002A0A972D|nr:ATP-binding protein [uncultured Tolumonas sp.]
MRRIFWKILLSFWLVILLSGIGTGIILTLYQDAKTLYSIVEIGERPNGITDSVARTLQSGGKKLLSEIIKPQLSNNTEAKAPRMPVPFVVDKNGKDLFDRTINDKAWLEAKRITENTNDTPGVEKVTLEDGEVFWIYLIRRPPPFPYNVIFELFDAPIFLFFMIMLTSLLFSGRLALSISRPIETLRDGLKAVSKGDFDINVSKQIGKRYDEFAELGRDTDSMAEKLKQLIDAQRRLLHDVSHDLRSPLARLQLAIGLMRQKPEVTEQMLQRIEQECHRLDSLVGEVLTLARMESGVPQPKEDYIDLIELLKSLVDDAQFEAKDSGSVIQLQLDDALHEGIIIQSRGELLLRAFDNLIRNALQHAGRGCHINIEVHQELDDMLVIEIADNGPGVADNNLASIFQPFFRSNNNPGDGLGLAITKRAIEVHGGTISAYNRPTGGLCMHVRLPCTVQLD